MRKTVEQLFRIFKGDSTQQWMTIIIIFSNSYSCILQVTMFTFLTVDSRKIVKVGSARLWVESSPPFPR